MAHVEVMEGFICPICMTDFKTPTLLTKHFEEFHKDDPEILKSLKDLFGKAKKKILKQDGMLDYPNEISSNNQKTKQEIDWGPQEIGEMRSHTKYFKDIRNTRLERYSMETNKLIIRLDKLLNNLPNDLVERKAHERAIVPWVDDKDVRLCPTCAKSFNLTRRKHHCRLCGVMMCHDCSMFLSLVEARKMTSPASVQDDLALSPITESTRFTDRLVQAGIGLSKLARSPSSSSLNSVLLLISDSSNNEQHFRVCQYCKNLLDARERLKARHFEKPVVYQFYDKMHTQIQEANHFIEIYYKMWNSLNEGESTYNLRDAQMVRGKIAKIGDNIDIISKRIATLVNIDDDSAVSLKQEYRLNQMVRTTAMIYLKNELLRTPPVPTTEEYEAIKKERQERIKARIAYERQLEEEQMEKQKESQREYQKVYDHSPKSPTSTSNQVVLDQSQGWGTSGRPGGNIMISSTSMDPFIEQMSNLRFYIKQAREECKFDEVAALEKNLKELQSAYFAMKQSDNS
ncbi:PREDICTED: rabenosyn-5 [Ceratosolen solmsi marchali]|uniref:Rabenosyn-5 n=1 Tax=Ceratosolen solmsi marchali TaxID=326594 RepID=A0AAJ6YEQ6_9HYME|nr:PREDICTED: rabenosyn-5 [Ceratosolen solmsi marchali]